MLPTVHIEKIRFQRNRFGDAFEQGTGRTQCGKWRKDLPAGEMFAKQVQYATSMHHAGRAVVCMACYQA